MWFPSSVPNMRSKKTSTKQVASKAMVRAGFLIGSLKNPEDGSDKFLEMII
jgi:hypothetical protein